MTALRRNGAIALTLLFLAGGWGWQQQCGISRQRTEMIAAEAALAKAQRQQVEAAQQLESLRQELTAERSRLDAALAAAVTRTRQAAGRTDETRWDQPPAAWPAWEAESPYVWLSKEALARLGVQAFTPEGSLTPELCTLLDIQPAARTVVSGLARRLLTEWRTSEAERAERTDQHPSNIGKGQGPIVTVRVPPQPELAARLREEFNAALQETLGQQRAGLLAEFARHDIARELGPEPTANQPPVRTKTYSVRRDGNMFHIAINIPSGSSLSTSGPEWRENIPAHLHTLFAEAFAGQGDQ